MEHQHPGRLTWNIKMEVWKIIFLSKCVIWRFHVNLLGWTFLLITKFVSNQITRHRLVKEQFTLPAKIFEVPLSQPGHFRSVQEDGLPVLHRLAFFLEGTQHITIRFWWFRNPARKPVDNGKYPMIYRVSYMSGGCLGISEPSTVSIDEWHNVKLLVGWFVCAAIPCTTPILWGCILI